MNELGKRNWEVVQERIARNGKTLDVRDEKTVERACLISGALGLRVVPDELINIDIEFAKAILVLAKARMSSLTSAEQLAE
jgi:hypothetical protein